MVRTAAWPVSTLPSWTERGLRCAASLLQDWADAVQTRRERRAAARAAMVLFELDERTLRDIGMPDEWQAWAAAQRDGGRWRLQSLRRGQVGELGGCAPLWRG